MRCMSAAWFIVWIVALHCGILEYSCMCSICIQIFGLVQNVTQDFNFFCVLWRIYKNILSMKVLYIYWYFFCIGWNQIPTLLTRVFGGVKRILLLTENKTFAKVTGCYYITIVFWWGQIHVFINLIKVYRPRMKSWSVYKGYNCTIMINTYYLILFKIITLNNLIHSV